ncbi:hypothetical protein ISS85_01315 [Candidatus Microgenomates bacterium]|nr:hypothetical protein [Candidatus Microgenomates bacterium]
MTQDLSYILHWWLAVFALGILVFPLTKRLFSRFLDFGYPFAKILAILLVSYITWLLGSLKILPFFQETIWLVIIGLAIINFLIFKRKPWSKQQLKIIIFEEVLFFLALLFWSWIRAHEPSIHGLEKFMDFGFINAILKSKFFPPHDMWLSPSPDPRYTGGSTINYYYFGHLTAAVLTKLTGINSAITYNLILANIFALCFTGAFSIGINLLWKNLKWEMEGENSGSKNSKIQKFKNSTSKKSHFTHLTSKFGLGIMPAGLLTGFLVTMAGNLHPIYLFLKDASKYWYPDATRLIPFTIHEFPMYSWVVADLHGHVFDIPFVLLTIATLFSLITNYQLLIIPFLGFLTAVLYMTNAWDGLIYLALSGLVILVVQLIFKRPSDQETKYKNRIEKLKKSKFLTVILNLALLVFSFFLFSLPFNLNFHPFVKGIGVNCPLSFLPDKWGPFIFPKGDCQRSPLYMLAILWGFFYFNAAVFVTYLLRKSKTQSSNDKSNPKPKVQKEFGFGILTLFRNLTLKIRNWGKIHLFLLLMIFTSTLLLIFPEFFYAKDIYPGHFRANTMFKLGYQAFIMMSIVSGYTIISLIKKKRPRSNKGFFSKFKIKIEYQETKTINLRFPTGLFRLAFFLILFFQVFLVSIYPYFAINSYYGNLKTYHGLDGTAWLKNQYSDDYAGILFLKNLEPRTSNLKPVVVEAVGESYTDYARVSSYSGLPTILGWPVHEWLWRGSYDEPGSRVPEVETIYQSEDLEKTKEMLEKYNVAYVFLGQLEREKYKTLNEEKFDQLGKVVFESGKTKIFEIR